MNEIGLEVLRDHAAEANDAATSDAFDLYTQFFEEAAYLGWIG